MRTVNFCKTNVPQFLSDSIEPIKSDDLRVYNTVDEVIINTNAGIQLSADS